MYSLRGPILDTNVLASPGPMWGGWTHDQEHAWPYPLGAAYASSSSCLPRVVGIQRNDTRPTGGQHAAACHAFSGHDLRGTTGGAQSSSQSSPWQPCRDQAASSAFVGNPPTTRGRVACEQAQAGTNVGMRAVQARSGFGNRAPRGEELHVGDLPSPPAPETLPAWRGTSQGMSHGPTAGVDTCKSDSANLDAIEIIIGPTNYAVKPNTFQDVWLDDHATCARVPVKSTSSSLYLSDILRLSIRVDDEDVLPISFGTLNHLCGREDLCRPCMHESRAGRCKKAWLCDTCHLHSRGKASWLAMKLKKRPTCPVRQWQ